MTRQERLLGLDAAVALRCHVPSACREHIHTINAPLLGILKNLEEFVEVLMPRSKYRFDSDLVVIFAYLQELFDPSGSAIFPVVLQDDSNQTFAHRNWCKYVAVMPCLAVRRPCSAISSHLSHLHSLFWRCESTLQGTFKPLLVDDFARGC